MIIKRMQRLADFQHDVIRHVHDVADAADADFFQSALQPVRAWPDFHTLDDTRRVTRAKLSVFNAHCNQFAGGARLLTSRSFTPARGDARPTNNRDLQRIPRHRRYFTDDADDAVQVRPVRRYFQILTTLAAGAAEIFAERLSDGRIGGKNKQAVHLVRQAEFLRRTHHALARDAENLPFLDDERLLVAGLQWQREVWQDERDFVAGLVVLRAANDGALVLAVVDLADGELVRAGHGVAREDLGDDDAVELAAGFVDALDFEAEQGEPLRQFLGRPG